MPTDAFADRRRCAHPTCNRFVSRTEDHCLTHRSYDTDAPAPPHDPDLPTFPVSDYRVLLDNDLRSTLAQATSEILEKGLIDELGSLRIVLLRVLLEEKDLAKLVTSITRIATVAAQAMRVQHAINGDEATGKLENLGSIIRGALVHLDQPTTTPAVSEEEPS